MQIFHKKLEHKLHYPLNRPYQKDEILFFDIETTGFLASASYVYLIGAVYYKEDSWYLTQWFAEDTQSEKQILETFFSMIISYKRIIHYNGSGFDLPYLEKKSKQYKLNNPFTAMESFDLYKKFNSYKKLLPVSNLKLKTMETFAGVHRKDKLSGEELIQIYANFLGKYQFEKLQLANDKVSAAIPKFQKDVKTLEESIKNHSSVELQALLLLHNEEDVTGLLKIGSLLYFTDIFEDILPQKSIQREYKYSKEKKIESLILHKELPFFFGKPIMIKTEIISQEQVLEAGCSSADCNSTVCLELILYENELTLKVPIYYGELKYFPDNYADYYYLPMEDMVVHKSVAQFVDKEFRQKAKASNCFLKKVSSFLPMPNPIFSPIYRLEYKDKFTFCEFNLTDYENIDLLAAYFHSLLEFIKTNGTLNH